jgi:hypothetical protein
MFFGMPDGLAALAWIPLAHAALVAVLCIAVPFAWRWWGGVRRVAFTVIVAVFVLQVAFHVSWNYLPPAW